MALVIKNAHVVTPGLDLGVTDVFIEGSHISGCASPTRTAEYSPLSGCASPTRTAEDTIIDASGLTLLPGFVDIHSHGRGGADFCDATDEAFEKIGRGKLSDGVTSFLATGLTRPEAELAELCRCVERYKERSACRRHAPTQIAQPLSGCASPTRTLATCLGVHLEGPFFNPSMAGAQNPAYLRDPDADMVLRLNAISPILKVSLAPELPCAEACIRALTSAGIVVSLGHSSADYDTFERARKAGATHLTHFCNAMMPIHHLRPTMVTGGLLADDVYAEIITDGVHLSDPMIRLIAKTKGPDRLMVITDAMCAAGEPDGIYSLGGLRVKVEKGRATLADVPYDPKAVVSNVAGSVALYPQCFKRYVAATGLPLCEAIKATGYNQLRSLGITDRGEIKVGQIADLVLVDGNLDPTMTVVEGTVAWQKSWQSISGCAISGCASPTRTAEDAPLSGCASPTRTTERSDANCLSSACRRHAPTQAGTSTQAGKSTQVGTLTQAGTSIGACASVGPSLSGCASPTRTTEGSHLSGCASPTRTAEKIPTYFPPSPAFYSGKGHVRVWRGYLPHWQKANVATFITLRAADSLPQERLVELRAFDDEFRSLRECGTIDQPEFADYIYRRREMVEKWLDEDEVSSPFATDEVRNAVEDAIWRRCPKDYDIYSFVVKSNHIHLLLQPCDEFIENKLTSFKRFTAGIVNRLNGTTGQVWQREHYDTLIRSEEHFRRVRDYIWKNDPCKAWDFVRFGRHRGQVLSGIPMSVPVSPTMSGCTSPTRTATEDTTLSGCASPTRTTEGSDANCLSSACRRHAPTQTGKSTQVGTLTQAGTSIGACVSVAPSMSGCASPTRTTEGSPMSGCASPTRTAERSNTKSLSSACRRHAPTQAGTPTQVGTPTQAGAPTQAGTSTQAGNDRLAERKDKW